MATQPTTMTLRAICPLYGLGWIATGLQLGPNATLRFIDLENENDELTAVGLRAISYRCLVEITQEYDPRDHAHDPWQDIQGIALIIEAALRIYHEGRIGVAAIIYYENNQRQSARILDGFIPNGQENYQIDRSTLGQFPIFFRNFETAYKKKPVALQYFSNAQQRFSKNDKAIDLCTSLESLFVPADSRGAKKVFLAQGMKILGFSDDEVQMIGDLYDFRNTVIHGDHAQRIAIYARRRGNYTTLWFENCENLIRAVLQKYVSSPW